MTPFAPPHHDRNGKPTRTWCGRSEPHPAHTWFAAEHRLTPMRCRGSAGHAFNSLLEDLA